MKSQPATGSALSKGYRWWTVKVWWRGDSRGLKLAPLSLVWYTERDGWHLTIFWFRRVIR